MGSERTLSNYRHRSTHTSLRHVSVFPTGNSIHRAYGQTRLEMFMLQDSPTACGVKLIHLTCRVYGDAIALWAVITSHSRYFI
jgi:hypothetical protein